MSAPSGNGRNPGGDPKVRDQLRALIERHCVTLRGHVEIIGRNLAHMSESSTRKPEALAEAESLAHQLKGSSGSIGFPQVSAAATALDEHLKQLCAAGGTVTAWEKDRLCSLYEELRNVTAAISPESSTLYALSVSGDAPTRRSAPRS